jgi:hypothetical protein
VSDCEIVTPRSIDAEYLGFDRRRLVANRESVPANGKKRLEERLSRLSKGRSFTAYVRENFEWLSQQIQKAGRDPEKWTEIAAWAVEEGLTGGKSLTPAGAKKAFERETARRKKLEEAAKRKERSQPAPIGASVVAADPQPPALPSATDVPPASPRKRLELKPVTIKKQP